VQGMWGRCAVVAASPGGPTEIITDRVDGLLTPAGDLQALVDALSELRADSALRERLAHHGRSSATRYDAHRAAPRLAQWLDMLATEGCELGSVSRQDQDALD
jgi:glycosyltransferase involved in cell wall biosynthesis